MWGAIQTGDADSNRVPRLSLPRFYRARARECVASLRSCLRFGLWSLGISRRPGEDPEMPARFWDGVRRNSSCRVRRMLDFWQRWPQHRLESEACYRAYPGGDAIDVGSHDGWYACLLAPKVSGTMVLLEPDPTRFAELHATLASLHRAFPGKSFLLLPRPCSDTPNLALQRVGEQLLPCPPGEAQKGFPAISLDEITQSLRLAPTFIKIDVEGHELAVLRSGRQTLIHHRPVLMVEMHGPELRREAKTWLEANGYREEPIYTENGITRALFRPA